jgi:hypothetical protein
MVLHLDLAENTCMVGHKKHIATVTHILKKAGQQAGACSIELAPANAAARRRAQPAGGSGATVLVDSAGQHTCWCARMEGKIMTNCASRKDNCCHALLSLREVRRPSRTPNSWKYHPLLTAVQPLTYKTGVTFLGIRVGSNSTALHVAAARCLSPVHKRCSTADL